MSTRYADTPGKKVSKNGDVTVDYSNASLGYIAVKHNAGTRKTKLRVTCGKKVDTYDLSCDGTYYYFPLQYGSGTYSITVYGQISGSKYAQLFGTDISAKMTDELSCYLYPNQRVMWDEGSALVKLADELCNGLETELEKIQVLYKWVSSNIKYNYIQALQMESNYLPDNELILEKKTGVCYDYASLLCAMLRSQGIYTQVATGYLNKTQYHAWNRVYVNGQWKMLDATFANKYSSSCYKMDNTF